MNKLLFDEMMMMSALY